MKEKMKKIPEIIKKHKVVCIILVIAIIAVIVLANILNTKPSKYEKKVKAMVKAMSSKSKMSDLIDDGTIDLRAATAWINAIDDDGIKNSDFKEELKETKKNDSDITELKKALKDYAKGEEGEKLKVESIEKPGQNKKNKKIWTVKVNCKYNDDYDGTFTVIFYNGKIIDLADDEVEYDDDGNIEYIDSFFKRALYYYND